MAKQSTFSGALQEPQRVPEGFLLVDRGDAWSWVTFLFGVIFLLIWCGVSFPIFIGLLTEILLNPLLDWALIIPLLFVGIFVVIGIGGIVWGIRWMLTIARLHPGELILPRYPLCMGETCRIKYRRQLRNHAMNQPGKVTAKIRCYEWVQYRQGTDTKTATHTVWEQELPDGQTDAGTTRIEYDGQISIPPQGPPTFEALHNQLRWEVRVTVDLPGITKDDSCFRLKIVPEVLP